MALHAPEPSRSQQEWRRRERERDAQLAALRADVEALQQQLELAKKSAADAWQYARDARRGPSW